MNILPFKDVYLSEYGDQYANYESSGYLLVRDDKDIAPPYTEDIHSILSFNIPPNVKTLHGATLNLYYFNRTEDGDAGYADPVGETIQLCRLSAHDDWVETFASWLQPHLGSFWATWGGDITETGAVNLTVPAGFGWMTWDDDGVNTVQGLVQDAIDNRSNLLSLYLRFWPKNAAKYMASYFYDRLDTGFEPYLDLDYTPFPNPSSGHMKYLLTNKAGRLGGRVHLGD